MQRFRSVLIAMGVMMIPAILFVVMVSGANEPVDNEVEELIPPSPPTREEIILRSYSDFIKHAFDSLNTVGAAYTIVVNGEVVMTETLGKRKIDRDEPVDEHTIFRLASVSKGFAGVLAAMLEEKGFLSLDDPVIDHYPGFRLKDSVSMHGMTINHLLSHTTGLVPHAYDNLVEAGLDLKAIIEQLPDVDIAGVPGAFYGYQNVLFSIFEPISERATGKSYAELLNSEIFIPLGMKDASTGIPDTSVNNNIAFPHLKGVNGYIPVNLHEGYYNVLPAAGVNASISDMEKWLMALLGGNGNLFSDDVLIKISTPVIYTPLKWQYTRNWEPFKERYYSLGWRIYDYKERRIVYHGGYVSGYRAEIAFCPQEQAGIAFLQNSPNGLASKVVPEFFNQFFDR